MINMKLHELPAVRMPVHAKCVSFVLSPESSRRCKQSRQGSLSDNIRDWGVYPSISRHVLVREHKLAISRSKLLRFVLTLLTSSGTPPLFPKSNSTSSMSSTTPLVDNPDDKKIKSSGPVAIKAKLVL
jgi:hypothetical protein